MIANVICAALVIGLLYSIVALGTINSFRVIGFPDMTPDGSFVVGAALSSVCLLNGCAWIIAILAGCIGGALCGVITSVLYMKFNISKLLSGILNMTMLYSISLRIMGTSNISLQNSKTIWSSINPQDNIYISLLLCIGVVSLIILVYTLFLKTNIGLQLRALGDSEETFKKKKFKAITYTYIGLAISNMFAALAGALFSQYQGFTDIGIGSGTVVMTLAGVIIGETILRPQHVFPLALCAVLGMVIYEGIISVCLQFGLPATDLKLATAVMTIVCIVFRQKHNNHSISNKQIGNQSI